MELTLDDLKNALPEAKIIQLTDDEKLQTVNQGRVDDAKTAAYAEAQSYCAAKYTMPFSPEPDEFKRLVTEIWIYKLYQRRSVPVEIEKRYDKAVSQLKDIARGLKTLGVDPAPAASSEGGAETNKTESDRLFTRDTMEGF